MPLSKVKILISGGGTGGHVFPAIAIADAIKKKIADADILFVGALGKLEMQKVPTAGYPIKGLWISGFQRNWSLKNLLFPFKLLLSLIKAAWIIRKFKPQVVIGVGGYASGPTVKMAARKNIPILLQEQNSFPGVTNKLLAKDAATICVAYDGMEKYFPKEKLIKTGNPIRQTVIETEGKKELAYEYFELEKNRQVVLIVGGSQGAMSINESIGKNLDVLISANLQLIWQTGKNHAAQAKAMVSEKLNSELGNFVKVHEFITKMDLAYAAADIVISRAGAIAISELCAVAKPCIFIPLPSAAENHQTKNAMALAEQNAAIHLEDSQAPENLGQLVAELANNKSKKAALAKNIGKLAMKNSASIIADEAIKLIKTKNMNLKRFTHFFFVGIGGIGMSALARYFTLQGKKVAGYDRTPSALTARLENEGISVFFSDDPNLIPASFTNSEQTFVVYTPAVKEDNKILSYFLNNSFQVAKRSKVLGLLSKQFKTIAVAGTHGKTSVSTMIAHFLKQSAVDCTAILGGISKNYQSNLLVSATSETLVTEADEFDKSFLQLHLNIAIITSADPDHLDIYGTGENMRAAFAAFAGNLPNNGVLIIKHGLGLDLEQVKTSNILTYSLHSAEANIRAENVRVHDGKMYFDFISPAVSIENLEMAATGTVNIENALPAVYAAILAGATEPEIRLALQSFAGVVRRFDLQWSNGTMIYIDDYAHHPEEINALIRSMKAIYPGKKITGIFQPHLFSRTRDFADGFAQSLDKLDETILLDIYPAREKPIAGVDSSMILNRMKNPNKSLISKDLLPEALNNKPIEILLTIGAGDIDRLVEPIKQYFIHRDNHSPKNQQS